MSKACRYRLRKPSARIKALVLALGILPNEPSDKQETTSMSIKKKAPGAVPNYTERWQELATDESRLMEAAREYRAANPKVMLIEAYRVVRDFYKKHKKTYSRR